MIYRLFAKYKFWFKLCSNHLLVLRTARPVRFVNRILSTTKMDNFNSGHLLVLILT